MCSRFQNEEDEEMATCDGGECSLPVQKEQRKNGTDSSDGKCKKCEDKQAVIVLRDNDTYCMSCLQVSVTHKFRSCLGKSRLMRSGERVLMAFSGGPSSALMLTLTKQGLDESSHKRLRFIPIVIYVDDAAIFDFDDGVRNENFRQIVCYVRHCGFPLFVTSLEKAMGLPSDNLYTEVAHDESIDSVPVVVTEKEVASLKQLFDSVKSVTCKEDLLVKLRQRLLCDVANKLKCTKIFLGDSETRIAVRVLSDIAQGKGQHISLNCGFSDDCYEDVLILRPMREILAKEVSYLVSCTQIPCVAPRTFTTKQNAGVNIQHLTETFVFGLQEEFPSTVSTIFRTGDKMGSSTKYSKSKKANAQNLKEENTSCILCLVPLDHRAMEKENRTDEVCNHSLQKEDVKHLLCYSCQIIANETPNIEVLPPRMINDAVRRMNEIKIREQIEPFFYVDGTAQK